MAAKLKRKRRIIEEEGEDYVRNGGGRKWTGFQKKIDRKEEEKWGMGSHAFHQPHKINNNKDTLCI